MQITISNNIRIRGATNRLRAEITRELTDKNPAYEKLKKRRKSTWGIEPYIKHYVMDMGDIVVPRGFIDRLRELYKEHGPNEPVGISYLQTEGHDVDFGPWNPNISPRGYQVEAIEKCVHHNGILVAPAGGGKTLMGCNIIHKIGKATVWLTHTKDLMYQSKKNAEKYLTDVGQVGVIGDGVVDWGSGKLIICMLQTLTKRPQLIDRLNAVIGLVVVDEAHHLPASMFIEVISKWKAKRMIGLTATPERKDGLHKLMYLGVGPKLHEIDRQVLYDQGFLIKPEIKFIYTDFDYEQASDRQGTTVDAGGGDIDYAHLMKVLTHDEDRLEKIARSIIDNYNGTAVLVLAESTRYCFKIRDRIAEIFKAELSAYPPSMAVVHGGLSKTAWRVCKSEKYAKMMVEAGKALEYRPKKAGKGWEIKVQQYTDQEFKDWQVTKKRRTEIIGAAERKEIDILFATQLAREGLDLPHLTQLHLATPKRGDASGGKDGAALEQEVGRVQRRDPDNPNKVATVFDYVDYGVGIYKSQYSSRRSVYRRLGMKVPQKPRNERDETEQLLNSINLPF